MGVQNLLHHLPRNSISAGVFTIGYRLSIFLSLQSNILNYLTDSIKQSNNIINATHPYPCGICKKNVNKNQKAIECTQCNQWIHIKCNGTSLEDYNIMLETNNILSEEEIADLTWICNKCNNY